MIERTESRAVSGEVSTSQNLASQAAWLRERAVETLRRYATVRRWIQIVFVLGGAFLGAVAGTAAKLLGPPHDSSLYVVAIVGAGAVFLTSAVFLWVDEKTMEAVSRGLEAISAAEDRDRKIAILADDFKWMTRLYATSRGLRDYLDKRHAGRREAGARAA